MIDNLPSSAQDQASVPAAGATPGNPAEAPVRRADRPVILSAMLIGAGVLLLAQNLGLLSAASNTFGALLFAGGGVAFALRYVRDRTQWGAIIPAGVLLTLAVLAGAAGMLSSQAGGATFFLGVAATFATVYQTSAPGGRRRWALYIAGGLAAVAVAVIVSLGAVLSILLPVALIAAGMYQGYRTLRAQPRSCYRQGGTASHENDR
jgi:hypothetical protein